METLTAAQRADKIFDMISHYEKYDGRLDNTENYLLDAERGGYVAEADKIITVVKNRLLKDGLVSLSFLWNIIGDEMDGAVVSAHDEWIEAVINRHMQDTLLFGTGFNPLTMPMDLEKLQNGISSLKYLYEPCSLERIFLVPVRTFQKAHGHVVKVQLSQSLAHRYLPSRALKCEARTHGVLRAMTSLGFQGQMSGDTLISMETPKLPYDGINMEDVLEALGLERET